MIKRLYITGTWLISGFMACTPSVEKSEQATQLPSATEIRQLAQLGFTSSDITKTDSGFLVEKDMFIPRQQLADTGSVQVYMRVAQGEQYRTFNLVKVPRTVSVSCEKMPASFIASVDTMINRYNRLNLDIKFRRVSGWGSISFKPNYGIRDGTLAFAGFPGADGNPYREININMNFLKSYSAIQWGIILQHELGHCVGLRHTDYMDRSYSCGGIAINEGIAVVGAVQIPGTPSTPNARSIMLACYNGDPGLGFNPNDIIALRYLYKK